MCHVLRNVRISCLAEAESETILKIYCGSKCVIGHELKSYLTQKHID
jgi:hypothetical protein